MPRLPRLLGSLISTVALFLLTGCGDDTEAPAPSPTATTAPTATATPTAAGTTVTAALTDFEVGLSRSSFTAGPYTFIAEQRGQSPHALAIKGPGVDDLATPTIQAGGDSERLAVTLQPGTYELWCPVGNHRAQGMVVMITVG